MKRLQKKILGRLLNFKGLEQIKVIEKTLLESGGCLKKIDNKSRLINFLPLIFIMIATTILGANINKPGTPEFKWSIGIALVIFIFIGIVYRLNKDKFKKV